MIDLDTDAVLFHLRAAMAILDAADASRHAARLQLSIDLLEIEMLAGSADDRSLPGSGQGVPEAPEDLTRLN